MEWYNFNISRWVALMLPTFLRKSKMISYLLALTEPLKLLHEEFLKFRDEQLYESEINGQVINLERVLNDRLDPTERRIYISDGGVYLPPVFYEEFKNQPVIFGAIDDAENPVFFFNSLIDERVDFNFYVHVPQEVFSDKIRVKSIVNRYRAWGRTYDVVLIVNEE